MRSSIFTKNSPRLDVHGEYSTTVGLLVNNFIDENIKLGNEYIAVIHGIGYGILKKKVHEILKNNRKVKSYYLNFPNIGETVICLDLNAIK